MRHQAVTRFGIWGLFFVLACQGGEKSAHTQAPAAAAQGASLAKETKPAPAASKTATSTGLSDSLPNGLLLSYSQFEVVDGKATSKPGPARLDILTREGAEWKTETLEDAQSNVFHKAMMLTPRGQAPGILTLGGSGAYVKLWRRAKGKLQPSVLWQAKFGGKFNRMRDAEIADLYGDGTLAVVVATHDQGVVAVLRQRANKWKVERIDAKKDTFVHEIEIGDLDDDGTLEVYATPSEPNKLDAEAQHGEVVRYVPKEGKGPTIVADLGNRHAKEIYVGDVDGDGTDEL
ncbi:MAG: VCBS repeat-containing protein, partial [Polyangiales bacterium]